MSLSTFNSPENCAYLLCVRCASLPVGTVVAPYGRPVISVFTDAVREYPGANHSAVALIGKPPPIFPPYNPLPSAVYLHMTIIYGPVLVSIDRYRVMS